MTSSSDTSVGSSIVSTVFIHHHPLRVLKYSHQLLKFRECSIVNPCLLPLALDFDIDPGLAV